MTDCHTHIMFEVDDGAKTEDECKKLLNEQYHQGVTNIVLTPHYNQSKANSDFATECANKFDIIKKLSKTISPDLNVYLGNELYYYSNIISDIRSSFALTINETKYILVEFSVQEDFRVILNAVNDFMRNGYCPVIAHIERYKFFDNMDEIEQLHNMGCLLQVNCSSVIGQSGFFIKRKIAKLINLELIDLVSSDCHNLTDRKPVLGDCATYIEKKFGYEKKEKLCNITPLKIVKGE